MYRLIIHGGAGAILDIKKYQESLERIISSGKKLLDEGVSAIDVVEHCVCLLEDDPLFNAGKGSVLTNDGKVECDASIMDGKSMQAGAIAGVRGIKNPIKLARAVMEKSEFVFLIGEGAQEFAKEVGIEEMPEDYFITKQRQIQLQQAIKQEKTVLDHSDLNDKKLGTVGAVALDKDGNLAAATSTGGIVNKKYGRVGDSAIIGAGTYAENGIAAISCTGYGEQFIRTTLAKTAACFAKDFSASQAAQEAIKYLENKVSGLGGLIMIKPDGDIAYAFNTPSLLVALADEKGIEVLPTDAQR